MRHLMYLLALLPVVSILSLGCGRSTDSEVAELRADLEAAHSQINELKAEIARNANNPKAKGVDNQPGKAKTRLVIVRGLRPKWEYPIFEGRNVIGRADEHPVEIDLQPQEPEERIWSSRQHAAITCTAGAMVIEDLSSTNGTYVNRKRVPPGEKRPLSKGDVIQIGEVQMQVVE